MWLNKQNYTNDNKQRNMRNGDPNEWKNDIRKEDTPIHLKTHFYKNKVTMITFSQNYPLT